MRVGVPTEINNNEYRVGLTPPAVAELTRAGHDVVVQSGAGLGVDFADSAYEAAGAATLPDAAAVFAAADMIVNGYAFSRCPEGFRVLNLNRPDRAVVISPSAEVLETSMDDIEIQIVRGYLEKNRALLED